MELTKEIKNYIDKSVLCWLATVSSEGIPNVSPKEIFTYYGTNEIIVANIASPQTLKNIKHNKNVCISFIDVFVQKGYKIIGKAEVIKKSSTNFSERAHLLTKMTKGNFPFSTITKVVIAQVDPIIAPKYILYPKTTDLQQIEAAKAAYGL